MSLSVAIEPPVCEFCGEFIEEDEQPCSALGDGRCCYP